MKKLFKLIVPFGLTIILLSCASSKSASILYSDKYDETHDQTQVLIYPYGEVKVPGKWRKTREYQISGQHFFLNKDSISLAVALQPWDKFEFSANNPDITSENFVQKFYEWDAFYMKDVSDGELKILKENQEKNYLIWNLSNNRGLNEYFLFGLKGKIAFNINISTELWDEQKKIDFLETVYTE